MSPGDGSCTLPITCPSLSNNPGDSGFFVFNGAFGPSFATSPATGQTRAEQGQQALNDFRSTEISVSLTCVNFNWVSDYQLTNTITEVQRDRLWSQRRSATMISVEEQEVVVIDLQYARTVVVSIKCWQCICTSGLFYSLVMIVPGLSTWSG